MVILTKIQKSEYKSNGEILMVIHFSPTKDTLRTSSKSQQSSGGRLASSEWWGRLSIDVKNYSSHFGGSHAIN